MPRRKASPERLEELRRLSSERMLQRWSASETAAVHWTGLHRAAETVARRTAPEEGSSAPPPGRAHDMMGELLIVGVSVAGVVAAAFLSARKRPEVGGQHAAAPQHARGPILSRPRQYGLGLYQPTRRTEDGDPHR